MSKIASKSAREYDQLIVKQMLKRINKDFEAKELKANQKADGTLRKKSRKRKVQEGVRQASYLAEASYQIENDRVKKHYAKARIKMLTSKSMRGSSAGAVADLLLKQKR